GLSKDEFHILDSARMNFAEEKSDVVDYLLDNQVNGIAIPILIKNIKEQVDIEVDEDTLKATIDSLVEAKLINASVDKKGVVNSQPASNGGNSVEVWYEYEKKPNIKGDKVIETTRYFCEMLCTSGKLFNSEDIQKLSAGLGYDVKTYGGGYYHNPETGETTPSCRHFWKPVKVVKKKGVN